VVFVGGKPGNFPMDLTFPPTGLPENLGGMERGRGGKGKGGETTCLIYYTSPTGSASNTTLFSSTIMFVSTLCL